MALFRKVHTEFWRDPKVIEELTPEGKLFFLYCLTNPNTTQIGIYKITKKQMAFELGYSQESINSLIDIFENKYKLIKYNTETRELAIKHWGKYNLDRGGKPMMDCVEKELKEVKDKSLINYVIESIEKEEIKILFKNYINETNNDTLDVSYNESSSNLRQEKEEEKEKEEYKEKEKKHYKQGENNYGKHTKEYSKSKYATELENEDESIYQKPTEEQLQQIREMLQQSRNNKRIQMQ